MRRVSVPAVVQPALKQVGRLAAEQGVHAYAVGGCVRDWLLELPPTTDLDIAVEGSGAGLARAAAEALGGTAEAHPQFGTATLRLPPGHGSIRRVDFAMCRKETYARPAAYPRVTPGTVADDLFRRDFTINAMAADLAAERFGTLLDPCGGRRDLARRVLRILHARSFLDDPSRLLRGVRFLARFGLRWDAGTARAAREAVAAGALGWLNAGRLRKEFDAMLREPDPPACLQALAGLLEPAARRGKR
mgnify:CR=1 FL=1